MSRLKVAVRVRPLSQSENNIGSISIINVEDRDTLAVTNIKVPEQNAGDSRERIRRFTFDYCFHQSATQDVVFEAVESVVGKAIKSRFNSCVLAYGQSSSGKTHTMMGFPHDPGLTPRLCGKIFDYLQEAAVGEEISNLRIFVSYLEIYNEKVRDLLLDESGARKAVPLKVREHPKNGPYVQGLTEHVIDNPAKLINWLEVGNGKRRVAATLTNPTSSRSHSVFTVSCAGAKLHLVDLAGSERADSRYYDTSRFREGANINKSLVALGNVISALAEHSSKQSKCIRRRFVPYRDSVLTWLLKDTLGGNSHTFMIATVSPSSACYSETVNTLRFGQRAKLIVSRPIVIEDPKESIIRELRAEIARLREILKHNQNVERPMSTASGREEQHADTDSGSNCEVASELSSVETSDGKVSDLKTSAETEPVRPLMLSKRSQQLRRTFSVDHNSPTMSKDKEKLFGSHDEIPLSKAKKVTSPSTSSTSSSRRSSLNKSTAALRSIPQKRALDSKLAKAEKAVGTESAKVVPKVEAKVDSIRKYPITKPRSQIVAAVTHRLYSKVKKKEAATDTDDINAVKPTDVPKELSICSNARFKLKELTQRALRAHKNRNEETQTDRIVVRVKEVATDVNDLKVLLLEMRDMETMPETVEMRDIGIECHVIDQFSPDCGSKNVVILTRTCGTQSNGGDEPAPPKTVNFSSPISFTKYLREHQEPRLADELAAAPIYTSSVNINISHNYINGSRVPKDSVSDDSLDGQIGPNVCFPTPDLISNHNSLDAHPPADASSLPDERLESIGTLAGDGPSLCVANCNIEPLFFDKLSLINQPAVCAPEVCVMDANLDQRCRPFAIREPERGRARVVDNRGMLRDDGVLTVQEPLILKSIMKSSLEANEESCSADECANNIEAPDSLEYHLKNKRVHFKKRTSTENSQIYTAMTNFLEEATTLMTNLTLAAGKVEASSRLFQPESFDFEVSVNGISGLDGYRKKKRKRVSRKSFENVDVQTSTSTEDFSAQTVPPERYDSGTQYEDMLPVNKYEFALEEACKRLEGKLDQAPKVFRSSYELHDSGEECFSGAYSLWNEQEGNDVEDSSMESNNRTYSDYGSLPRRTYKRRRTPTCSPSAFLRQLTAMRRQIIETSKEELLKQTK